MIDLSADLAEGMPTDRKIWPMITSANVACGGHVGDEASMAEAARLAREYGVRLGAHPSYPDRANFGRQTMSMDAHDLRTSLVSQIAALREIATREGIGLRHVKPHGALYNDAHHNRALATTIVEAIRTIDARIALVASDASQMAAAARASGMPVIREAFADRRYMPDGSLMPRSESGSLLSVDEAADQAELLARESMVIAGDGSRVRIPFDTICIHADMEHAVERLRAVRKRVGGQR
jgi:UPF0271 protein